MNMDMSEKIASVAMLTGLATVWYAVIFLMGML
jgi:hypothetical protein